MDGMGWDGMGWDEWDGMGWDGMGWDGMGWDGMRRNGMGWDGMGWDGMGRNGLHPIELLQRPKWVVAAAHFRAGQGCARKSAAQVLAFGSANKLELHRWTKRPGSLHTSSAIRL